MMHYRNTRIYFRLYDNLISHLKCCRIGHTNDNSIHTISSDKRIINISHIFIYSLTTIYYSEDVLADLIYLHVQHYCGFCAAVG